MPNIGFVLPHFLYWLGVVTIPLVVMFFVYKHKDKQAVTKKQTAIAYLFLLCGGFMGLHRLYLKNIYALVYIALFLSVLLVNQQIASHRILHTDYKSKVTKIEFLQERATKRQQFDKLPALANQLISTQASFNQSTIKYQTLSQYASYLFYLLMIGIIIDALILSRLVNNSNKIKQKTSDTQKQKEVLTYIETIKNITEVYASSPPPPDFKIPFVKNFVQGIDTINHYIGQYVAIWTLIAVFIFYYEVMVRYVFNSPTNWAHESMFLLLGMQYLFAGGFALKEGAHVRVDVIYTRLSKLNKARVDVLSSIFFFIFIMTLMVTGFTFFLDSWSVNEVSFTEWAVSYSPTKFSIFGGAVLILLQGVANLCRDFYTLKNTPT